jgi:O-acetylhomoserine/O-acetylserine sulfhydrylase-like pyridoxal-dependent enzyme
LLRHIGYRNWLPLRRRNLQPEPRTGRKAALTTAVLASYPPVIYLVGQKSTYRGTASLVLKNLLPRLGVSVTRGRPTKSEAVEKALTAQTRMNLVESPSNRLLQITDLRVVAELARAHNVLTMGRRTEQSAADNQIRRVRWVCA